MVLYSPVPEFLTCSCCTLSVMEGQRSWWGRTKRTNPRREKICFPVWSLESFMFCYHLHFTRTCFHFLCNTPFSQPSISFPSFLSLISVAPDNGQKWQFESLWVQKVFPAHGRLEYLREEIQSGTCVIISRFSQVLLCGTLWTAACQAPLPIGFSRQEYWSGLPCPLPGDPPNPGIRPSSLTSSALAGGFFTTRATWKALKVVEGSKEKHLIFLKRNLK